MSLPIGFHYLNNMAIYIHKGFKKEFIKDYGRNLENKYDRTDKKLYKERIFCLDCPIFETCKGRFWKSCPYRAKALKIIRGDK